VSYGCRFLHANYFEHRQWQQQGQHATPTVTSILPHCPPQRIARGERGINSFGVVFARGTV